MDDNPLGLPPWPYHDDTERTALLRALDQGQWWRAGGGEVEAFEREFADLNGAPAALAVTNGTHALELALRLHDVGPGDEVVVPAFTFVSTSLAVQNIGAVPVPADVDPRTWCMTPDTAAEAITARTKAIIPVHMAGQMADLDGLGELADAHGCVIVQDAAHAQGASRAGRRVGEYPFVACYSFQNGKLMTAGEGGALTFPDQDLAERAYLLHTCGRPRGDLVYEHLTGGSNYRMNEFSAAVLRAQLDRLPRQTKIREDRAALLDELLAGLPLATQARDPRTDVDPQYMYLLLMDPGRFGVGDRDRMVERLRHLGVPAFPNFPPVYRTDGFWAGPAPGATVGELAARCQVADTVGMLGLWLHHRILLAEPETLQRVAALVAETAGG
ncbi:aminotransferase class I/II-fold pyridoxal phosphate-dependent enzyme [Actinomadura viridis]|uniref:aminotransferase class I/II-fold pyridoxal phosphate-dependent enzyme n=1 Tax=Actinomadura viridis TaxID=58110 RepID=UPI00368039B4